MEVPTWDALPMKHHSPPHRVEDVSRPAGSWLRREDRSRGMIAVYVAVLAVVLIGFVGLAIDSAHVVRTLDQLQAAADSAALAAASEVKTDSQAQQFVTTRNLAAQIALAHDAAAAPVQLRLNKGNSAQGDIVVGRWDPVASNFTPTTANPDAVQVTARRAPGSGGKLSLYFGGLFKNSKVSVARQATAHVGPSAVPLLLVLDAGLPGAFTMSGASALDVLAGRIHVNSHAGCAMITAGGPSIDALRVFVVGQACIGGGTVFPTPKPNSKIEPDPLSGLQKPTPPPIPQKGISTPGTYDAGYYEYISLTTGTTTLLPGTYIVRGPVPGTTLQGVQLSGDAMLVGDGVMLFARDGATISTTGQSGMDLTPLASGAWAGVTISQNKFSQLPCVIEGTGRFQVEGTIYIPGAGLELRNNPDPSTGTTEREIGRVVSKTFTAEDISRLRITGLGVPPSVLSEYAYLVQ